MPHQELSPIEKLVNEAAMQTQEQLAPLKNHQHNLFIGVPKEVTMQENRVPLTPSSVEFLVNNGHRIVIESKAGLNANFYDQEYSEAGAEIAHNCKQVYEADIILKIDPPTLAEVDMIKPGKTLISALQLTAIDDLLLKKMKSKKINAIAYEYLEDNSGSLPIIRAMSELAGHAAVLVASEYLTNSHVGKGELLGGFAGIPPTQIVILGAGSVGEYAARAAIGLGANVKVFDNNPYRLRRLQNNLGQRVFTSTIHPKALRKALAIADVAIGAVRTDKDRAPCIVTEEMVANMKAKSVIIDISADKGGVFETTQPTNHEKPMYKVHDVIHFAVPNITSRVARTASYALSNIFTPLLMELCDYGSFAEYIKNNCGGKAGTYMLNGQLTNSVLGDRFKIPSKNIDFLLI